MAYFIGGGGQWAGWVSPGDMAGAGGRLLQVLVDQVVVACFHPEHAFQGLEDDDVLNYEKRSPHPTINILR